MMGGRRPIGEFQRKSPRRISPRGLHDLQRCGFAGDLPDVSNRFWVVNKLRKMQRNSFDKLKLPRPIIVGKIKNPLPVFRGGAYDVGDDVIVPLICPTRQVQE